MIRRIVRYSLLALSLIACGHAPLFAVPATITPTEINDVLENPFVGWAPDATRNVAVEGKWPQPHRLVYAGLSWRTLEPTKGNFDWNGIENTRFHFDDWASTGTKIVLRLYMDYSGTTSHMDIPDWLYEEIGHDGTWYDHGPGEGGFSPNYKNETLIANHERMMNALGARYNNDPRIAFIQLGSLGHWGEWHTTYISAAGEPGRFPPNATCDRYIDHYIAAFPDKKLLMRRPFQKAKDNHLGQFNDMFGNKVSSDYWIDWLDHGYYDYLGAGSTRQDFPAMGDDWWKYGPSGGEFGNSPGFKWIIGSSTLSATIAIATTTHTSWLGPSCPAWHTTAQYQAGVEYSGVTYVVPQENIDALLKTMGYRFVLSSAACETTVHAGSTMTVTMNWNNKGVAPFYYPWKFELSLSTGTSGVSVRRISSADIRTWYPGATTVTENIYVPRSAAAGTYSLCVSIIDPATDQPGVNFAIAGKRVDGRYAVCPITILPLSIPKAPRGLRLR